MKMPGQVLGLIRIEMKRKLFWFMIPALLMLTGCLSFGEKAYKIDFDKKEMEIGYYDIRSLKEDENKDNVESDWAGVKEEINKQDFDEAKIRVISKKIYQDGDVLSGKALYRLECIECFESKLEFLKEVGSLEESFWDLRNNEIVLVTQFNAPLKSMNGKQIPSEYANIYVWPSDAKKIEFVQKKDNSAGKSLLPNYLAELNKKTEEVPHENNHTNE